jgi:hypothetical protein
MEGKKTVNEGLFISRQGLGNGVDVRASRAILKDQSDHRLACLAMLEHSGPRLTAFGSGCGGRH